MKIYFDGVDFAAGNVGPNCFAKRLAAALSNMGVELADSDDYDVGLVFIEPTQALNMKKPFLQRLDGLWFKPEQMTAGMNRNIHAAYDAAAGVVWQSEFDKAMSAKWFGPRDGWVIPNGIELTKTELRSEALGDIRARYQKVFVCSANWHPQKRLLDNITAFKSIRANQHPSSCLIVMGDNPDVQVADPDVFYTGSIRHDLCAEVYSIADWMIHLAWLDHCPNVVVEAISQGCPVICSSEGGTKELVGALNGVVIPDVEQYQYQLVDYDNPPRVRPADVPKLPEGFRADPSSVDIVKCASLYAKALRSAFDASR